MALGSIETLREMIKADPAFTGSAETYDFHLADDIVALRATLKARKKTYGTGQCPILPQVTFHAPKVKFWIKGPIAKGNAKIPSGTLIASGFYAKSGYYMNKSSGNHAAIYISQDDKGILVADQWDGKEVKTYGFERTLPFKGPKSKDTSNHGDHFHVVLTHKLLVGPRKHHVTEYSSW